MLSLFVYSTALAEEGLLDIDLPQKDRIDIAAIERSKAQTAFRTDPIQVKNYNYRKIEKATFYTSVAALWTTTALDIHSGERLDKTRFYETNWSGGIAAQVVTSSAFTGLAIWLRSTGNKGLKWFSTALLSGVACRHAFAAAHNYGLD